MTFAMSSCALLALAWSLPSLLPPVPRATALTRARAARGGAPRASLEEEIDFGFAEEESGAEDELEATADIDAMELEALSIPQLKEQLHRFGVRPRGRKSDIIAQIRNLRSKVRAGVPTDDLAVHYATELHRDRCIC